MRVKMSIQTPPAPTASAVGHCPTVFQIVGRPGTVGGGRRVRCCLIGWLVVFGLTAL